MKTHEYKGYTIRYNRSDKLWYVYLDKSSLFSCERFDTLAEAKANIDLVGKCLNADLSWKH